MNTRPGLDRGAALASYRRLAAAYDAATRRIERKRRRASELLRLRSGARVAAAGAKLYPPALSFLNFWVRWRMRNYASTLEGLERPWRLLEAYVPDFTLAEVTYLGSGYVGSGNYVAR